MKRAWHYYYYSSVYAEEREEKAIHSLGQKKRQRKDLRKKERKNDKTPKRNAETTGDHTQSVDALTCR